MGDRATGQRRWLVLAVAGLVLVGVAAWWVVQALGTCRPLDRLLGGSGCVASHVVAEFAPLSWETLTVPPGGETVSVFGRARTVDGWQTALVTVTLETGEETGRHPIPMLFEPRRIRVSPDHDRVGLFCDLGDACVEGGYQAIVVSPVDARPLEFLAVANPYRHTVPGRSEDQDFPALPDWADVDTALMPDGRHIAEFDEDTGEIVLRAVPDGDEVRRLQPSAPFIASCGVICTQVVPSPSGRRIALVYTARTTGGTEGSFVRVWETESGELIADIAIDYPLSRTIAWTPGEDQLITVARVRNGTDAAQIDVFALP